MEILALPRLTRVIAFVGTDQASRVKLLNETRLIIDHSLITRVVLTFDQLTFDSDIVPLAFLLGQKGAIFIQFGQLFTQEAVYTGCLTTFDPSNPNGVVWTDALQVDVRSC